MLKKKEVDEKSNRRPVLKDAKGQEWTVEWWAPALEGPSTPTSSNENITKKKPLRRCGGCKQALYCSESCQKIDWNVSTEIKFQNILRNLLLMEITWQPGLELTVQVL